MFHKLELDAPPEPKAICEHCGGVFKSKQNMQCHQYNSPKCRQFIHKDKPAKERTVVCEQCGIKCANKYILQIHINRIHTKKYTFVCEKCPEEGGKGFHIKNVYEFHMFTKHGEGKLEDVMKWVCPEEGCGKRWRLKRDLKFHLDWHKGIKRFTCEECGKQFNKPVYLRNHKKLVHHWSGMKWQCELCDKQFKTEKIRKFHVDEIHLKTRIRKKATKKDNDKNK